ncbi:MAG: aspartate/glutamate racemase family protein, partial [Nitrospirota bacterium]|nr:aspartate/glutamate racemase family protein [Nitrospirota bacterium]
MLNTRFPRPPGDIGNPETWPFPVRYEVVEPATVGRVVTADPPVDLLLAPFVAAGERLVAAGARAITTSCGFLALFQAELTQALPVPVMTSSLIQVPMVQASLPRG